MLPTRKLLQTDLFLKELPKSCLNILMIIRNITLAVLAITSSQLFAANHMLFIGGGGEPSGVKTIFDPVVETLGKNVQGTNWKYQVSFNGGHSLTESLISSNFTNPVAPATPFTKDSYKKLIEDYKRKINSGEISSGDQLMILINSHGAEKSATNGETSHRISVTETKAVVTKGITNYDNLDGSEVVSVDALAELIKLTNEKGIKLGIVDLSCHSGNTQALKQNAPNTCIVSSTGTVHYGYSGVNSFNVKFLQNLKTGVSLEQAFLEARLNAQDYGTPMISTPEGKAISDEVYSNVTPYLYYKSVGTDKLTNYVQNNSSDYMICKREAQFKDLLAQIDRLQTAANGKKDRYSGEELKKLLQDYKYEQDSMIKTLNLMGSSEARRQENFSTPTFDKKGKPIEAQILNMTWKSLAVSNPDENILYFKERLAQTKDPIQRADYKIAISNWTQAKVKRAEIVKKFPEMANLDKKVKDLTSRITDNSKTAFAISMQERKFYSELYKNKQTKNSKDPCSTFVF